MRRAAALLFAGLALVACSDDDAGPTSTTEVGALGDGLVDEDCAFLVEGAFMDPGSLITEEGGFDFQANAERYDALAEAGPEDLRAELEVIAARMHQVADAFVGVDPEHRTGERFFAATEAFADAFDAEYRRAATAVFRYTTEHCTAGG